MVGLDRLPRTLLYKYRALTDRVRKHTPNESVKDAVAHSQAIADAGRLFAPVVEAPVYEYRRTLDQEVTLQNLQRRMQRIGSGEDGAVTRLQDNTTRAGVMSAANSAATFLGWHQVWGDTPGFVKIVLQNENKYSQVGAFFVNSLIDVHETGTTSHLEGDRASSRTILPLKDYPGYGIEVAKFNQNVTWGYYDPNYSYEYTLVGLAIPNQRE